MASSSNINTTEVDTFIQDKLTEWNLSDYIETFEREKIDKSVFLFMPDEAVAKLIKPMGHYYKFILEREKFKTSFIEAKSYSKVSKVSKDSGTHLRALLKQSVEGKYLLKQPSLMNNSANLAKIIIENLLNKEKKLKISRQEFIFWAQEITSIWCKEDVEKWYAPSKYGKAASGKLYYHYTNKTRKLKAAVIEFEQEEAKNIEKQIEEKSELDISELMNTSLDNYKKILFLWERTFDYRKRTCGNDIAQYFNRYPQLRPPLGTKLIELDFKLLDIAHINALQEKWPDLHPKILHLATKQSAASNLLQDLDKIPPDTQAWRVFPYLFRPVLKKTGLPKKPWKPSYKEQSDGFITWINVITDIEKILSTHRKLMSDYKLTLQPFVIAVLSEQKVEAAYVIINDQKYQFQDVTNAIAFCWKSFYVLNAAYPVSCEAVWIYIEEEIYKYKKIKRHFQSVKWVRDSLENISCENTECKSLTTTQSSETSSFFVLSDTDENE